MDELLIGQDGKIWSPSSLAYSKIEMPLRQSSDLRDHAIATRGYILLKHTDRALHITLRPYLISRKGMISLFFLIAQYRPERTVLASGNGPLEIFGPYAGVIERIEILYYTMRHHVTQPLIAMDRLSPDRVADVGNAEMAALLNAWTGLRGRWRPSLIGEFGASKLFAGSIVTRTPKGTSRQIIDHWGIRRNLFGREWVRVAQDQDLASHPDRECGAWMATAYRQTLDAAEPRLENIDYLGPATRGSIKRREYTRLILPWHADNGDRYVTALSITRRTSTLRSGE